MLRPFLTLLAASVAVPALAQTSASAGQTTQCLVRVNPTPASWIIEGYDPFGDSIAEGTFSVTFVNEGGADCSFTPTFELSEQAFGLSKGTGKSIRYAVLNLSNPRDVTPRAGQSLPLSPQRELALRPGESRSLMYKLVAQPTDVQGSGTFTQNVTIQAQDGNFQSRGGAGLVLGINVLPSARVGLSGAFSMNDGQAVVNLGELREGVAPVPLHLQVSSTGDYDIVVSSANSGQLRLGSSQWFIPYSVAIAGNAVNLTGAQTVTGSTRSGLLRDSLPFQFVIGDVSNRRAGVYSDVVSVSITAR